MSEQQKQQPSDQKPIEENDEGQPKSSEWIAFFAIVGIILILGASIFVTSYLIRKDNERRNTLAYNGFEFVFDKNNNVWTTLIQIGRQTYYLPTHYNPREVENVSYAAAVMPLLMQRNNSKGKVYITTSPDYLGVVTVAFVELKYVLGDRYSLLNMNVSAAFSEQSETGRTLDLPIISCQDATDNTTVVWLHVGEQNSITCESGCVIVEASSQEDILRAVDRLIFAVLKIM